MRYLAFVFLSLAVAGCGSSPAELQYYRLPAVAAKAPVVESTKVLVVEPVMVASYLNSNALVYQNNEGYEIGALSDNGRYIALSKERTNADNNLYLVDLQSADKTPVHITPHQGNVSHGVYGFSRDNNQLIFGSDEKSEFKGTQTRFRRCFPARCDRFFRPWCCPGWPCRWSRRW